jgi:hypothetical protein
MKRLFFIFAILTSSISTFATGQETDLLIIENDTIYLKIFPLEDLNLTFRPFGKTRSTAPSTACWRGYRAVWRIIDNKLYLEKILHCYLDRESGEENIKELFKKNGIEYSENNGLIFASWCTFDFYRMTFSVAKYYVDKIYLYDGYNEKEKNKKVILSVEKGVIDQNYLKEK